MRQRQGQGLRALLVVLFFTLPAVIGYIVKDDKISMAHAYMHGLMYMLAGILAGICVVFVGWGIKNFIKNGL